MSFLLILQILVSLMLATTILLQSRGTGLGTAWGGSGESYRSKRGAEKALFTATIILSGLFILLALINVIS